MSFRLGFIFLITFFSCWVYSQPGELNFFQLDRLDGLSDNFIIDIEADDDGFIWIGTDNGLNKYDGYSFQIYSTESKTNYIPENRVKDILYTSQDELWVGFSYFGVALYDSIGDSFKLIQLKELDDYQDGATFVSLSEDKKKNLFLLTSKNLYIREFNDTIFRPVPEIREIMMEDREGDDEYELNAITSDESNGIWLSSSRVKLLYYNHDDKSTELYDFVEENPGQRLFIYSMLHYNGKLWIGGFSPQFGVFDPQSGEFERLLKEENLIFVNQIKASYSGGLWVSSTGGLVYYNPMSGEYNLYTERFGILNTLTSTGSSAIYEDTAGVFWVGTGNSGINYAFRDMPFQKITQGTTSGSISEKDVSSVLFAENGELWIGLGSGVIERHPPHDDFKEIYYLKPLYGNTERSGAVFTIFEAENGDIYCSSWRGGVQKFNRTKNKFEYLFGSATAYMNVLGGGADVRDIAQDEQGMLWISAHSEGVFMIDEKKKQVEKYLPGKDSTNILLEWIYDLEIDDEGYVWVTSAYGLNRIDPGSKTVKWYTTDAFPYGLTENSHHFLLFDKSERLWIGTESGLNLYDKDKDLFYGFDKDNGLPVEQVRSLIQDKNEDYWMSTPYGLLNFRIDISDTIPSINIINSYNMKDGLLQDIYAHGCSAEDEEGRLYFGGVTGIDYFDPLAIKPYYSKPRIYITKLSLFNEQIYPGKAGQPAYNENNELVLSYKENMLSIEFLAMNFFNNSGNRYAYKLMPATEEWIHIDGDRSLVFSNLQPGHYRLSLKVNTENGYVEEVNNILKFYVKPPFWQTNLFRFASVLFIIILFIISVNRYTNTLRKRKDLLELQVRERTHELESTNIELTEQTRVLNEANVLLSENKLRIENQAEELRTQQEALAAKNADLEVLNSTKDKLFSIIAHDLKNPFGIVSGFADLLYEQYDNYTDERKKELLLAVKDSIGVAHELLENLLQWSRSQTGRLECDMKVVAVTELFQKQENLFRPSMQQKELELTFDPGSSLWVLADQNLIETILRNLISNAFKFTRKGGKIHVSANSTGDDLIEIRVHDSGTGIEQERIDKLFRIDQNTSTSGTEGEKGTGLGLLLCKEFAEKMNGNLRMESKPGEGTSVFLQLSAADPMK